MSEAAAAADDRLDGVRADLAGKPDGVLETVAERHDVPLQAVLDCLPAAHALAFRATASGRSGAS